MIWLFARTWSQQDKQESNRNRNFSNVQVTALSKTNKCQHRVLKFIKCTHKYSCRLCTLRNFSFHVWFLFYSFASLDNWLWCKCDVRLLLFAVICCQWQLSKGKYYFRIQTGAYMFVECWVDEKRLLVLYLFNQCKTISACLIDCIPE